MKKVYEDLSEKSTLIGDVCYGCDRKHQSRNVVCLLNNTSLLYKNLPKEQLNYHFIHE